MAIDTFQGFEESQFLSDLAQNLTSSRRRVDFTCNSVWEVQQILKVNGVSDIELVEQDICRVQLRDLVDKISFAFIDVDLLPPVLAALEQVYALLVPGGYILVHDVCNKDYQGAGTAAEHFASSHHLPMQVIGNMAIFARQRQTVGR